MTRPVRFVPASLSVVLAFALAWLVLPPASPGFAEDNPASLPATVRANVLGHRFSDGDLATTIPFESCNRMVFLPLAIDTSGPLWFVLDSGAGASTIDRARAKSIGLSTFGQAQGHGAGTGSYEVRFASGPVTLRLPGLSVFDQTLAVTDLAGLEASLGRRVDGILGADFFYNFVVTVDYGRRIVTVADTAAAPPPAGAEVLPLEIENDLPFVHARLTVPGNPTQDVRLLVDSGSGDAVDHPLILKSTGRLVDVTTGVGLGKATRGVLGRVDTLAFGRLRLTGAPSACCGGTGVSSALLGGRVLDRFSVTFDYVHGTLTLVPNAHLHDPFAVDASGLVLRSAKGGAVFRVAKVIKGSPAEAAGVRAADEVTAVDGRPASEFTLDQVEAVLEQSGRRIRLAVERDGRPLALTLALRSLL